jgi:hypothetical protein
MLMTEGLSPSPLGEALVGRAAPVAGPEDPQSVGLREEHRGGPRLQRHRAARVRTSDRRSAALRLTDQEASHRHGRRKGTIRPI